MAKQSAKSPKRSIREIRPAVIVDDSSQTTLEPTIEEETGKVDNTDFIVYEPSAFSLPSQDDSQPVSESLPTETPSAPGSPRHKRKRTTSVSTTIDESPNKRQHVEEATTRPADEDKDKQPTTPNFKHIFFGQWKIRPWYLDPFMTLNSLFTSPIGTFLRFP